MSSHKKKIIINLVIAIFLGGGLFLGVIAILFSTPSKKTQIVSEPQVVTVMKPTLSPTSTPTLDVVLSEDPELISINNFQVGVVVQIINTEGAGLRLRSNPGTSSSVQFIGEEQELFTVINGPVEQDGYVWWYLESPYDKNRSGWAAADYLELIEETD